MVVRFVAGENAERPNARRFALAGVGATVVDVGVAIGLVSAGLGRLPAGAAALVIAAIVSRILHARYTLRGDQLDRWIRQPPVRHGCDRRRCRRSRRLPRHVRACGLPGEVRRRGDLAAIRGLSHASCCSGWCARAVHPDAPPCAGWGSGVSVVVPAYRRRRASPTPSLASEANLTSTPVTSKSSWSTTARRMAPPTLPDAPVRTRWSCSRRTLKGRGGAGWCARRPRPDDCVHRCRSRLLAPSARFVRRGDRGWVRRGDRQPSPRRHRHAGRHLRSALVRESGGQHGHEPDVARQLSGHPVRVQSVSWRTSVAS